MKTLRFYSILIDTLIILICSDVQGKNEERSLFHKAVRKDIISKINEKIHNYNINKINDFREGKKLLVLDIDYTLFDHKSDAQSGEESMRPFLHEFLTRAYKDYDIVIWSATGMKHIDRKMKFLGVADNPNYKIAFYLDIRAMIEITTLEHDHVMVKPLHIIWGKYKQFSLKNTIMIDDFKQNFITNPQSGLLIKPFKDAHINKFSDRELYKISDYLELIAKVNDFRTLDHSKWEEYRAEKCEDHGGCNDDESSLER